MGENGSEPLKDEEVDIESLLIEFLDRPDIDFSVPGSSEIINQLEKTLRTCQKVGIPERKIKIILEAVAGLWKKYTTSDGQIERREREMNISGEREPELNHALGVMELSLEILDEARELREIFGKTAGKEIDSLWARRTEIAFTALTHDVLEDGKFTLEELIQFLGEAGIPERTAGGWVDHVVLLSRLKDENGDYVEGTQEYLDKVNQSLISRFVKISGDILRNAQSELKTKKQRSKFRDGYCDFFRKYFPWIQELPAFERALEKIEAVNPEIAELLVKVRSRVAEVISLTAIPISKTNGGTRIRIEAPDDLGLPSLKRWNDIALPSSSSNGNGHYGSPSMSGQSPKHIPLPPELADLSGEALVASLRHPFSTPPALLPESETSAFPPA
jgi:hypothetical protein